MTARRNRQRSTAEAERVAEEHRTGQEEHVGGAAARESMDRWHAYRRSADGRTPRS